MDTRDDLLILRERPDEFNAIKETAYLTRVSDFVGWGRKNSLWPMPMGLACCAIELMVTVGPRYDLARCGAEALRFSPRQADLMVVSGTVTKKMATAVARPARASWSRCWARYASTTSSAAWAACASGVARLPRWQSSSCKAKA